MENLKLSENGLRVLAVKESIPEKVPHIHVFAKVGQIEDISLDADKSGHIDHGEWLASLDTQQFMGFAYKKGEVLSI